MERIYGFNDKIISADDAVNKFFKNINSIAFSGMGGQSVPKEIPEAIHSNLNTNNAITLYTGGGTTKSFEKYMSGLNISRRYYYLSDSTGRLKVNSGKTFMMDYFVSQYSGMLRYNQNMIDIGVIEATAINGNGIVPSLSLDSTLSIIKASRKIIIEINTSKPDLSGLHDIYSLREHSIIRIKNVNDRIGSTTLKINSRKIAGIVLSDKKEEPASSYSKPRENHEQISGNIWEIIDRLNLYKNPIQVGAGSIASDLIDNSPVSQLKLWCEIIPSKWHQYIGNKIKMVSGSAIYTLPGDEHYTETFLNNFRDFKDNMVLRPNDITNSKEVISRLNVITIQQAIQVDIYGSANVSHIDGNIYNGVGGSGDFCGTGKYTMVVLNSVTKDKKHSTIVPLLPNVDIPRQYVDFVVTENGIADLRWKDPRERAVEIINKCAHVDFKDRLLKYFNKNNYKHMPYNFNDASEFYGA